jgi:hypothetical protein
MIPDWSAKPNLKECYIVISDDTTKVYQTESYAEDIAKKIIRDKNQLGYRVSILKCTQISTVELEDPVKVNKCL